MAKFIIVKADTNDADYIQEKSLITEEQIEIIKPVIEAIKNFEPYKTEKSPWSHRHNYPNGDICRDDLGEKTSEELYGHLEGFELFNEFTPYDEYGIHTIESVEIIEVIDTIKLL